MKKMKNNQAITLIALVITIIVLLVLAGTTIAMLITGNGILNQTKTAKIENEIKTIEEKARMLVNYARTLDKSGKLTKDNLIEAIETEKFVVNSDKTTDEKVICRIDGKEVCIIISDGSVIYLGDNIDSRLYNIDSTGTLSIKDKTLLKQNKVIKIPNKLNGIEVKTIGQNCFKGD